MAKLHQYNAEARARIAAAVRKTEAATDHDRGGTRRREYANASGPFLSITQADIEHGFDGQVRRARGDWGSSLGEIGDEIKVNNPGAKVWAGSTVITMFTSLSGAPRRGVILKAWSATRIRGIATAAIAPGESRQLTDVVGIDGPFPEDTAIVTLPTEFVSIASGLTVWAELQFVSGDGSKWFVYSADCDGGE